MRYFVSLADMIACIAQSGSAIMSIEELPPRADIFGFWWACHSELNTPGSFNIWYSILQAVRTVVFYLASPYADEMVSQSSDVASLSSDDAHPGWFHIRLRCTWRSTMASSSKLHGWAALFWCLVNAIAISSRLISLKFRLYRFAYGIHYLYQFLAVYYL